MRFFLPSRCFAGHPARRYFFSRLIEPAYLYQALQTRLLREVELSLLTAELLQERGVEITEAFSTIAHTLNQLRLTQ